MCSPISVNPLDHSWEFWTKLTWTFWATAGLLVAYSDKWSNSRSDGVPPTYQQQTNRDLESTNSDRYTTQLELHLVELPVLTVWTVHHHTQSAVLKQISELTINYGSTCNAPSVHSYTRKPTSLQHHHWMYTHNSCQTHHRIVDVKPYLARNSCLLQCHHKLYNSNTDTDRINHNT